MLTALFVSTVNSAEQQAVSWDPEPRGLTERPAVGTRGHGAREWGLVLLRSWVLNFISF